MANSSSVGTLSVEGLSHQSPPISRVQGENEIDIDENLRSIEVRLQKGKNRAFQHKGEKVKVAVSLQNSTSNTLIPSIMDQGALVNPLSSAKEEQVVKQMNRQFEIKKRMNKF
jgi:hypothetical protein